MAPRKRKAPLPSPLQLAIASEPQKIAEVEEEVERYLLPWVPAEDDRDSIAIALTEALSNAIYHGNRLDPRKQVVIWVWIEPGQVKLRVKDEGEGFDPSALEDPLTPENLLRDRGRGIFILRALMDSVDFDFSQGGTVVTLVKKLKGPAQ
ncbi:MAG: ATP-binding protein [candidate division KSB1 bacterium]|nr:ATP-binding protein [candidate division KSB1 bacterium]